MIMYEKSGPPMELMSELILQSYNINNFEEVTEALYGGDGMSEACGEGGLMPTPKPLMMQEIKNDMDASTYPSWIGDL